MTIRPRRPRFSGPVCIQFVSGPLWWTKPPELFDAHPDQRAIQKMAQYRRARSAIVWPAKHGRVPSGAIPHVHVEATDAEG